MLAYYTSIIKKEEIVRKLTEDANELASLANDLVCELKVFSVACNNRNVENSLDAINKAVELSKVVSTIISNVEGNYKAYVSSLIPQAEQTEEKQIEKKEDKQQADQNISSIMEAVKTLKDLKDSLGQ